MIDAVIIGGSGYVGGELLRFLLFHPYVKIVSVTSQLNIGKKISEVHPNLKNITQLKFESENLAQIDKKADIVFLALPNGVGMKKIKYIDLNKIKVIDIGPDFRIKDPNIFNEVYKRKLL